MPHSLHKLSGLSVFIPVDPERNSVSASPHLRTRSEMPTRHYTSNHWLFVNPQSMTSIKVPPHQSADMSTSTSAKHAFWQPSLVPFFERLLSTHIIYSRIIYYCILYCSIFYCSIICSSFISQMPTSVPNKRYNQIPPRSYCTFNTRPHRAVRGLALILLNLPMQASTYMPGWSSFNLRTQWYPSKPTQCDVTEGFPHTLPRPKHSVLITYWHAFKGLSRPSVVNASIFYILLWSQDSKPLFFFNSI